MFGVQCLTCGSFFFFENDLLYGEMCQSGKQRESVSVLLLLIKKKKRDLKRHITGMCYSVIVEFEENVCLIQKKFSQENLVVLPVFELPTHREPPSVHSKE